MSHEVFSATIALRAALGCRAVLWLSSREFGGGRASGASGIVRQCMLRGPGAAAARQRHHSRRAAARRRDPDDVGGRRDVHVGRGAEMKVLNRGPTPGRGLLRLVHLVGAPQEPREPPERSNRQNGSFSVCGARDRSSLGELMTP